ncbi:MAG: cation-translocating P-type ATPase [Promethearchaeota archaeon]
MEIPYYARELNTIFEELETNSKQGLSTEEANKRLELYGFNEIPKVSKGFIKVYLAPLFNWLIVIYLIGALIMFILSLVGGGSALVTIGLTLLIVLVNCSIAIFQQYRATKKLNALRELSAPTATIIRDSQKIEITTKNVVVGDILVINQGDKIPADARIIECANMEANEASLTGESESAKKLSDGRALNFDKEISIGERKNMVFYGTYVTIGNGKAVVVKTGPNTEIGKLSHQLELAGTSDIPIRQKMNHFGKWLGIMVMGLWGLLMLIKLIQLIIINFNPNSEIFDPVGYLNSTMDLMPINLPLVTTIVLLTGLLAMAHQGVIIRNIASVDSLGRVSVVCSDKTGTLTKNQMCVQNIWTNGSIFKVTGSGYSPEGEIIKMDDPKNPVFVKHVENHPHLKFVLISGFLNNNSALVKNEIEVGSKIIPTWNVVGSPTEGALMVLFQKGMGDYILEDYEQIKEYPFDSKIKRMTKIYRREEKHYSFTKGASEVLLPLCSKILYKDANVEFSEKLKNEIMEKVDFYAGQGYRILSLCYKEFYALPSHSDDDRDTFESDLTYLGFVTILDPPREGVKESVEACHEAGVDVVMITGDSPITAKSIAKQISIIKNQDEITIEGKDIKDAINSADFDKIKVFARVSPEHKQEIVKKYKKEKRVVAMTGDGVNDALALNLADAGIAMGITGTDVAKEAADMVISDDSFNSIVTGIQQGRGIFARIRSLVVFFVCTNIFEGIVQVIFYIGLGLPYWVSPKSTYYLMWVFLSITVHVFPALGITFDKTSKDVMKEKPKDSEEILSRNTLILMVSFGILLSITMSITYFICYTQIYPVFNENFNFGILNDAYLYSTTTYTGSERYIAKTLTMLMVVLFFCESFLVLQIRRPNKSLIRAFKEDHNTFLYSILLFLFCLLIALMYIPYFQILLKFTSDEEPYIYTFSLMYLTALDWLVCFLISLICIVSFEFVKYFSRRKGIVF